MRIKVEDCIFRRSHYFLNYMKIILFYKLVYLILSNIQSYKSKNSFNYSNQFRIKPFELRIIPFRLPCIICLPNVWNQKSFSSSENIVSFNHILAFKSVGRKSSVIRYFFPSNDIPMIKRVSLKNTRELNSCTYANLKASFTFNCLDHQNYQLMNLHQLLVQLLTFDNIKGNAIKWNNITDTRVIKIETIKFWHSKIESKGRFL